MSEFIGGVMLSRLFYGEVVAPILAATLPGLVHATALLGPGSEVLGYDTPLSTDHDWGPRLLLFLPECQHAAQAPRIVATLEAALPEIFRGYPVRIRRTHERPGGDEVGSMVIAANIARDLMRICFSIERRYAPYSKWFGTAFARLACGPALSPILESALLAEGWRAREARLAEVYAAVAALHNGLGVTPPVDAIVSRYYDRPYLVIHADRVVDALRAAIEDPAVRALPLYGAIDQLSDSTDFLGPADVRRQVRPLYARPG